MTLFMKKVRKLSSKAKYMCRCVQHVIGLSQKRPLWSKAWCCVSEILLKIGRFGGGKSYRQFGVNRTWRFEGKTSVRFTPPKSSSHIWSHGTLYLTSSVKGILGNISICESAFEERGRFFSISPHYFWLFTLYYNIIFIYVKYVVANAVRWH